MPFTDSAYKFFGSDITVGSPTVDLSVGAEAIQACECCLMDSTHAILAYSTASYTKVCCLTISGNTVTASSPVTVASGGGQGWTPLCAMDSTHAILVRNTSLYGGFATAYSLTLSGSTITVASSVSLEADNITSLAICAVDSTHAIVSYRVGLTSSWDATNTGACRARCLLLTGTTITVGSVCVVEAGYPTNTATLSDPAPTPVSRHIGICAADSTHAMLTYPIKAGAGVGVRARLLTLSGTTVLANTAVVMQPDTDNRYTYDLVPIKLATAYYLVAHYTVGGTSGSGDELLATILTTSGTVVNVGAHAHINSRIPTDGVIHLCPVAETTALVVYRDSDGYCVSNKLTISGGNVTVSKPVPIDRRQANVDKPAMVQASGTAAILSYVKLPYQSSSFYGDIISRVVYPADLSIPNTPIVSSPATVTTYGQTATPTYAGTVSDGSPDSGIAMVQYQIDSLGWIDIPGFIPVGSGTASWSVTFPAFTAGVTNTLYFRAKNGSGVYGPTTTARTYMYDSVSPTVVITSPTAGFSTSNPTIPLVGTAADSQSGVALVEYRVNGGAWVTASGTTSWTGTATLTNGNNTIEARSTDAAGRTSTIASVAGTSGLTRSVYLGGVATTMGGTTINNIARWTGSAYSALSTGVVDGTGYGVKTMLKANGILYIGGSFTTAGGTTVNGIAAWDGTSFIPMGTGLSGGVCKALAVDELGYIYAGGSFTSIGGVATVSGLARWDGSVWTAINLGGSCTVTALAIDTALKGLYVGGDFIFPSGRNRILRCDYNTWTTTALGSGLNDIPECMSWDSVQSTLYVGGPFTDASGVSYTWGIAKWSSIFNWASVGGGIATGAPSGITTVSAIHDTGTDLYVTGRFSAVGYSAVSANSIAKVTKDTELWSALGTGLLTAGDIGTGLSVTAVPTGDVFVGGQFDSAGGAASTASFGSWYGGSWTWVNSTNSSNTVKALVSSSAVPYSTVTAGTVTNVSASYPPDGVPPAVIGRFSNGDASHVVIAYNNWSASTTYFSLFKYMGNATWNNVHTITPGISNSQSGWGNSLITGSVANSASFISPYTNGSCTIYRSGDTISVGGLSTTAVYPGGEVRVCNGSGTPAIFAHQTTTDLYSQAGYTSNLRLGNYAMQVAYHSSFPDRRLACVALEPSAVSTGNVIVAWRRTNGECYVKALYYNSGYWQPTTLGLMYIYNVGSHVSLVRVDSRRYLASCIKNDGTNMSRLLLVAQNPGDVGPSSWVYLDTSLLVNDIVLLNPYLAVLLGHPAAYPTRKSVQLIQIGNNTLTAGSIIDLDITPTTDWHASGTAIAPNRIFISNWLWTQSVGASIQVREITVS